MREIGEKMTDRENEIAITMDIVNNLCIKSDISLIAKMKNGIKYVAIKDHTNGKEYIITTINNNK